jgi:PAS domain S-box-containing protein
MHRPDPSDRPVEQSEGGKGDDRLEAERRRLILDSALDAVITIDAGGKITDWNRRAESLFGWGAQEVLGKPLSEFIIPHRHRRMHDFGMKRFLETGEGPILGRRVEISALMRDGTEFPVELTVSPARIGGEWMFSSFIRDITEKKNAEMRLLLQIDAARILAEDRTLEGAVAALLDILLDRTPWQVGAFWQLDAATRCLILVDMRSHRDADVGAFLESSRTLCLEPGIGLPGRAMALERPVWIGPQDLQDGLPRAARALEAGLRSGLAFPIFIAGKVIGVFEFFSLEEIGPDPELESAIVAVGRQLGQLLERRRTGEELRLGESLMRLIMDGAPALIGYLDTGLRYRFVNRTYEAWFGHAREAIAGRTVEEVLGPKAFASVRPRLEEALSGREVEFEDTLPYRTAGTRFVRINYVPHRREDGAVDGIAVFVVDLSERRRLEDEVLASEARSREAAERLAIIFNNSNDIILLAGVEGGDRYRVLEVNDVYLARSGRAREDLLGRLLHEVIPPEIFDEAIPLLRRLVDSGQPLLAERKTTTLRKESILELRVTPISDAQGRVTRLLIVGRDISDLRRREEELRQSQKMEAVGRLAGGIAHDFNNLLTAIGGFTELAMGSTGDPAALKEMLGEVKRSADRAAALTGQLLAFSRKQILSPKVLDLNAAVAGMETLLRRVIGEDLELSTLLAPRLRPVRLDPGQLEQVILNLALNARDAMPKGGRLTLETSSERVEETEGAGGGRMEARPGAYVVLSVSDTGTGMTRETRERIFEPFFTTKEQGKGTGMGLATVYGIVRQSGGHIQVHSEPGEGSRFRIFFPAADGDIRAGEPPAATPRPQGKGELILLVEDEDVVRAYVRKVLENLGYRVRAASDGRDALEAAAGLDAPIRLLLTDVVMPGMNGRELWDRMKPGHPGMAVLFMSGYAETAIVHHGVLDEDVPFLAKPFTPGQLAQAVGKALASSSLAGPG